MSQPRSLHRLVLLTAAGVASAAGAHGLPASVVEVLTWDGAAPARVKLSRGLGIAEGEALRFVCPQRWGGPETALMVAVGEELLVLGRSGLVRLDATGAATVVDPSLHRDRGRAMAGDGVRAAVLTMEGELIEVAPGPQWSQVLDPPPDALLPEDTRWWVATGDAGRLALDRVSSSGVERVLDVPYDASPTLVEADRILWVRGSTSTGYRLDRVDGDQLVPVVTSAEPIHGPVAGGFVVVGGQPMRLEGDTLQALAVGPRLGCLRDRPDGLAACVVGEIHEWTPDAGVGGLLVSVAALVPPSLEGLPVTAQGECKLAWTDLALDAGLADDLLDPWSDPHAGHVLPAEDSGDDAGCESGGTGRSTAWVGWAAMSALLLGCRRFGAGLGSLSGSR